MKKCVLAGLTLFLTACGPAPETEHYDILIKDTLIVDGTGRTAFSGTVAIQGERVVAVGDVRGGADIKIDGSGRITCPGFIDPHSHADTAIMKYPLAENLVMQGITTFLGGNCGSSPAPSKDRTFADWLSDVEEEGIAVNYAPLVGHHVVRTSVMGDDFKRTATDEEIEEMKAYVDEAMAGGAIGLSSFVDASPSEYASIDELIALAKVAQNYGGIYVPHTRHIQSQMPSDDPEEYGYGIYHGPIEDVWVGLYRGYQEALEISRQADIPLHIAHFSNAYKIPQPHPDFLEEAVARASLVEIIDKPREEGIDVTFDVITFTSSISGPLPLIESFFSGRNVALDWVQEMDEEEFIQRLETWDFRQKLRDVYDANRLKLGMIHTKEDPYWADCFRIESCEKTEFVGKTVGEIARVKGTDGLEAIFDLLVDDPKTTWIQFRDKRGTDEMNSVFIAHPLGMPCTDMTAFPARPETDESGDYALYGVLPSPIAYGLFAHYIGTYVREKGLLSVEEAVRKATSAPAQRFGLKDRGALSPGAYADIVVFDLETIQLKGDFMNPARPPDGIEYVLVNGKVVYKDKSHTGERAGRVLRRVQ